MGQKNLCPLQKSGYVYFGCKYASMYLFMAKLGNNVLLKDKKQNLFQVKEELDELGLVYQVKQMEAQHKFWKLLLTCQAGKHLDGLRRRGDLHNRWRLFAFGASWREEP